MNKLLIIVSALLTLLGSFHQGYARTPLRIARIENIPDQFIGGEILKAIYNRLNIPMILVDLPAKRAIELSSAGILDGEVHRNIRVQEQYPTLLIVRPAINYIEPSVFSKKYQFSVTGWDAIKDYNIGIVRGVGTSEDGTKGMQKVQAITTMEQMMGMLANDRLDVAVSDLFSGLVVIKKSKLAAQIHVLAPPLQKNDLYHYLHEKHRDLIPALENAIQDMRASGELEQLRQHFMKEYLGQIQ